MKPQIEVKKVTTKVIRILGIPVYKSVTEEPYE